MSDVKISDLPGASALTGVELVPIVQGGTTKQTTAGAMGGGYKVYRALLSQSGTDAPVATVLKNTLGGVPSYVRLSTGNYNLLLTGAFPVGKVARNCNPDIWNSNAVGMFISRVDNDTINIETTQHDLLTFTDMGPGECYIELLVYP